MLRITCVLMSHGTIPFFFSSFFFFLSFLLSILLSFCFVDLRETVGVAKQDVLCVTVVGGAVLLLALQVRLVVAHVGNQDVVLDILVLQQLLMKEKKREGKKKKERKKKKSYPTNSAKETKQKPGRGK